VVKTETRGLETYFQVVNELIVIGYPSKCVFVTDSLTTELSIAGKMIGCF
jgi:hypothetical protein